MRFEKISKLFINPGYFLEKISKKFINYFKNLSNFLINSFEKIKFVIILFLFYLCLSPKNIPFMPSTTLPGTLPDESSNNMLIPPIDFADYNRGVNWLTRHTTPSSPSAPSRPRPLDITYHDYGLTINVGCKTFAFSSYAEALPYIVQYYSDPEGTEKLYNEGKLFDQPKTVAKVKRKPSNPANPRKKTK